MQSLADGLALACLAPSGGCAAHQSLAAAGVLASFSLLLLPPVALTLLHSSLPLLALISLATAAFARQLLATERQPSSGAFEALCSFLLFPETILRWLLLDPCYMELSLSSDEGTGDSKGKGGLQLFVGSLPSPATLRMLSLLSRSSELEIVNTCSSWRGYAQQCTQLGIKQTLMPRSSVDPSEAVRLLLRKHREAGAPPHRRALAVFLHCETGAHAAAIAAAFLCRLGEEPRAAAARVSEAARSKLACEEGRCRRLAALELELARGPSHAARKGKPMVAGGGRRADAGGGNSVDKGSGRGEAAAGKSGDNEEERVAERDEEEVDDSEERINEEEERARRRETYLHAVQTYGLPSQAACSDIVSAAFALEPACPSPPPLQL